LPQIPKEVRAYHLLAQFKLYLRNKIMETRQIPLTREAMIDAARSYKTIYQIPSKRTGDREHDGYKGRDSKRPRHDRNKSYASQGQRSGYAPRKDGAEEYCLDSSPRCPHCGKGHKESDC